MTPYETLSFIIIGFILGLKMQIDGIKTGGWDYLGLVIRVPGDIKFEAAKKKGA